MYKAITDVDEMENREKHQISNASYDVNVNEANDQ